MKVLWIDLPRPHSRCHKQWQKMMLQRNLSRIKGRRPTTQWTTTPCSLICKLQRATLSPSHPSTRPQRTKVKEILKSVSTMTSVCTTAQPICPWKMQRSTTPPPARNELLRVNLLCARSKRQSIHLPDSRRWIQSQLADKDLNWASHQWESSSICRIRCTRHWVALESQIRPCNRSVMGMLLARRGNFTYPTTVTWAQLDCQLALTKIPMKETACYPQWTTTWTKPRIWSTI